MSTKTRTAFFCSQCGAEHSKWQGQCRECGAWNVLIEEKISPRKSARATATHSKPHQLQTVTAATGQGIVTGIAEFDWVAGGTLLPGAVVLIAGEPGIGKSTLLLQLADALARRGSSCLYICGEESPTQIRARADRLGIDGAGILLSSDPTVEEISDLVTKQTIPVVMVDSVQTLTSGHLDSPAGTIAQVRDSTALLVKLAKTTGSVLILAGHVTKEGMVAGPKLLEHMVDTVISFEGDSTHLYRLLRATKNRFGSVAEIGLFLMTARGLVEVANPSSLFLGPHDQPRSGAVAAAVCEGNRPLLVEVQALVTRASYGSPQRVAGGIDHRKLALLVAILEKRCGFPLSQHDVFVSVAGGLRLSEPALDLPILVAIASSLLNKPVSPRVLVAGEVGLSGEVRGITLVDQRVAEATKLGFTTIVVPEANRSQVGGSKALIPVADVQKALDVILV